MAAYEGPATLKWWANSSFAVQCKVLANIEATDAGWLVSLTPASAEDRPAIDELPNPWQLCFEDGSAFQVDFEWDELGNPWIARDVSRHT